MQDCSFAVTVFFNHLLKAALHLRSGVLPLEGRNWISCVKKD